MHTPHPAATPPDESWTMLEFSGPFALNNGPMFIRLAALDAAEPARFGLRVEEKHCNPLHICHGGMLATFMDIVLARGLQYDMGKPQGQLLTMSMSLDYLAAAPLGAWLESRVSVLRKSRTTGFVQAVIYDGETPVLRGNGIFRIPAK